MKKLLLYFLLLMAIPALAQPGHQDGPFKQPPAGQQHPGQLPPGPLMKAGPHSRPDSRKADKDGNSGKAAKGMNARDYDEVVRIISKEVFDEKRLNTAKRVISVNPMNTRQILNICNLFTYEANRLEFAKFAYNHCVDPNKFYLIDEAFLYESSKEELHDFIFP